MALVSSTIFVDRTLDPAAQARTKIMHSRAQHVRILGGSGSTRGVFRFSL